MDQIITPDARTENISADTLIDAAGLKSKIQRIFFYSI